MPVYISIIPQIKRFNVTFLLQKAFESYFFRKSGQLK